MKLTLFFTTMIFLAACSSTKEHRKMASEGEPQAVVAAQSVSRDLTGTYLGVADYKTGHKGPNKAAVRIYFEEVAGEKGSYNVVLLEYYNLLKIAPKYIASNKLPKLSNKIGYLKHITQNIMAYKAVPGKVENTFDLYPLVVSGDQIVTKQDAKPRVLTLSKEEGATPIDGATISKSNDSEPEEVFFPTKDDEKRNGLQYGMAKLVYKKAKLDSTWRKKFLTGPYLATYGNKSDVVLELSGAGDAQVAQFKINEATAGLPEAKRKKMFTNEKSAFLKGDFSVTEPIDGMFIFSPVNAEGVSGDVVKGKIGMFIDIFDATKSLNQDVVELVFVDSEHPEDFLMYYEHPDNGEGSR